MIVTRVLYERTKITYDDSQVSIEVSEPNDTSSGNTIDKVFSIYVTPREGYQYRRRFEYWNEYEGVTSLISSYTSPWDRVGSSVSASYYEYRYENLGTIEIWWDELTIESQELFYISYYGNGANVVNVPPKSKGYLVDENAYLSGTIPSRRGYEFLGWSENPSATEATYLPGAYLGAMDRSYSLYAIWEDDSTSSDESSEESASESSEEESSEESASESSEESSSSEGDGLILRDSESGIILRTQEGIILRFY